VTNTNTPEGRAWAKVRTPSPKGRYEHAQAYRKRVGKQEAFRQRVTRDPATACWLWSGAHLSGPNGHRYPMFYHNRRAGDSDNNTRSAFPWMVREWFPDVELAPYQQTTTSCGRDMCISPFHRLTRVPGPNQGQVRMDHPTVLEIYALRDSGRTQASVGEQFGISPSAVHKIWHGIRWSSLTGHGRDDPSRSKIMSGQKALDIYRQKSTGRTMTEVAEEFGVGRTTVNNIWLGEAWSHVTHQPKAKPTYRPRLSNYKRRKVIRARGTMSAYAAANELKVGKSTVLAIWKREEERLLQEQGA